MSNHTLKIFTALIPTLLIGGFEFFRHSVLLHNLSMDTGNYLITIITFIISYAFATWMFRKIEKKNQRITSEREVRVIYEERERLAKELHDSIAQTLFLLKVHLKKGKVDEAGSLVNSIDTHLRQAIFNLRIPPDEKVNLSNRIQNWLKDWSTISGIDVQTEMNIKDGDFSPTEKVQLFGIIQESFTNIRKHSEANSVYLKFHIDDHGWKLVIEDDGKGFNISDIHSNQYGISMLKERSESLESSFEIDTKLNQGTKIILRGKRKRD